MKNLDQIKKEHANKFNHTDWGSFLVTQKMNDWQLLDFHLNEVIKKYNNQESGVLVCEREEMGANAKLISKSYDLLEALEHTLEVLYQCDCPPELMETYGNLFMNYNNLIHEIKS